MNPYFGAIVKGNDGDEGVECSVGCGIYALFNITRCTNSRRKIGGCSQQIAAIVRHPLSQSKKSFVPSGKCKQSFMFEFER